MQKLEATEIGGVHGAGVHGADVHEVAPFALQMKPNTAMRGILTSADVQAALQKRDAEHVLALQKRDAEHALALQRRDAEHALALHAVLEQEQLKLRAVETELATVNEAIAENQRAKLYGKLNCPDAAGAENWAAASHALFKPKVFLDTAISKRIFSFLDVDLCTFREPVSDGVEPLFALAKDLHLSRLLPAEQCEALAQSVMQTTFPSVWQICKTKFSVKYGLCAHTLPAAVCHGHWGRTLAALQLGSDMKQQLYDTILERREPTTSLQLDMNLFYLYRQYGTVLEDPEFRRLGVDWWSVLACHGKMKMLALEKNTRRFAVGFGYEATAV